MKLFTRKPKPDPAFEQRLSLADEMAAALAELHEMSKAHRANYRQDTLYPVD